MNFKLTPAPETFKPVTISITFETVEELQEFQIRMGLYGNDLKAVRPNECYMVGGLNQHNSASQMAGITGLRKAITRALGSHSVSSGD